MSPFTRYSLTVVQEEARQLVQQGRISRKHPIYALCAYIPAQEWTEVERELELNDFLLRDQIGDLIGSESYDND